ncbi:hypothetical protein [Cellulomonas sp.]|uniref:DUF6069 family protein n=1 Tax=Cellulomonas sp. TaxID=40001 RepID=UPI001B13056F|nr:hypothetical protein [Cellulomonas sp.]MBO9553844.1 hypothetical protein [Cellulomonas sp.]
MTVPPRDSQYPHPEQPAVPPTAPVAPAAPAAQPAMPPAVPPPPPAAVQPVVPVAVPAQAAVPVATPPPRTRVAIDAGRYWGGVAATAVVAALVGVVGVVVFERIFDITLVNKDPFGTGSSMGAYVVGAIATTLVAALLLQVLVLATPEPSTFFGWIMGLGTLVAALLPLTWTDDTTAALCSGLVNLLIGIAVWSLLTGVLARTSQRTIPLV